jgi:Ca-activated chloride channel family protein
MPESPQLTFLGKLVLVLFIAACGYGAYRLIATGGGGAPSGGSGGAASGSGAPNGGQPGLLDRLSGGSAPAAEIGIAYGTEKKRWLEWAVAEFAKTPEGSRIKVNLIPMGSLEAAQAVLAGDQRIHVWSPASALYKDVFVQEWAIKQSGNPILREEPLALTPMVFVFWAERYGPFVQKYGSVSLKTVGQALGEKSGWAGIAQKPEWGLFKFGHTHPNESNSGLMTLVLMAYEHQQKTAALELKDILSPELQSWMGAFERGVSGLSNSTGNMMRDMVLRGPSSYDALFVYESTAIDYLKNAEGRWGELRLVYPQQNMWNDNPYYILNAPWSSADQRKAAGLFLDYLLSEPVQKKSLEHGFRPGNPAVPIKFAGSPFLEYQRFGLSIDVGRICEPPRAEVLNNLLASWQRSQPAR